MTLTTVLLALVITVCVIVACHILKPNSKDALWASILLILAFGAALALVGFTI